MCATCHPPTPSHPLDAHKSHLPLFGSWETRKPETMNAWALANSVMTGSTHISAAWPFLHFSEITHTTIHHTDTVVDNNLLPLATWPT